MLHAPVKLAPGSMANLLVLMSPLSLAVAFKVSNSATVILALMVPEISAFWQFTSPSTIPLGPTTSFPLVVIVPSNVPSILMSPFEIISPLMVVPALS